MMHSSKPPLQIASVGLGNWAGRVLDLLLRQHDAGNAGFELVAGCEPNLSMHPERQAELRVRGIKILDRFDHLLNDSRVESVVLPVPIHLHRPMTEQSLQAGKSVLVEKPVAGCVDDVDAMIAAQHRANLPVLVSFQDTFDPAMLDVKRRILSGEIGKVRSATLLGCWPREDAYYARTTWAGKIRHQGACCEVESGSARSRNRHSSNHSAAANASSSKDLSQSLPSKAEDGVKVAAHEKPVHQSPTQHLVSHTVLYFNAAKPRYEGAVVSEVTRRPADRVLAGFAASHARS